ncbi:MAG: hypothetical protein IJ552_03995 [Prevotella sp.]|nr:hypothetical protein [Prevotella sp.]
MKKILFLFAMILTVGTANANVKYATFVAPTGSGGSYDAETSTYTWTKNSDNLMTVFTFENGELANYKSLHVVRISGTYSNPWRANVLFSDGKNKSFSWYNYYDKNIDLSAGKWGDNDLTVDDVSHTLADVTAIRIGGASDPGEGNSYSVVIDWTCVYLENDDDAVVTAAFGKPANNATYSNLVYTSTQGYSNLMPVFTGAAGDFSKFGKLQFEIQGVSGNFRVGYYDGSTFTGVGASKGSATGWGGGGVKHVDLADADYTSAAGTATSFQFGTKNGSGSATVRPDNMFLVRSEAYDRSFTAGQTSTVWLPFALTEEEVAAAGTFYELTAATSTALTFSEVATTEAYKPYIFVAKATGTPFSEMKEKTVVAPKTCSYTVGAATFVGSMKDTTVPSGAYGYNATDGVFSVTTSAAVTIAPFRGYITIAGSDAHELTINFDGDATGISTVKTQVNDNDNTIYNLNGQRVGADYKGLVIKNGKKFIAK